MRPIQIIRSRLGITQVQLAEALQVRQSTVSRYDCGTPIPPWIAEALIAFAKSKGLMISYDHVYGVAQIPRDLVPVEVEVQ